MAANPNAEHHTTGVRWSAKDEAHIATVAKMPSLSCVDDKQFGAFGASERWSEVCLMTCSPTARCCPRRLRIAPTPTRSW